MRCGALTMVLVVTGAIASFAAFTASPADICEAVALVDVHPDGDPSGVLKKGDIQDGIADYTVSDTTGEHVFCSHGGECYPRFLTVHGRRIEAMRLTNCKLGANGDLVVDRSKNSASALRVDDTDNELLSLTTMCFACAGNAADIFVKAPSSRCGDAVGRALAGDRAAIAELNSNPSYCDEQSAGALNVAARPVAAAPPDSPAASLPPANPLNFVELALTAIAVLYFVPSLVGFVRRKRNALAIFALNLLLGWTFLGWVGSLVWSLLSDPSPPPG